ncbi:unnamed protein product [Angiostrongylus costaricensis]|uniref:Calponin-homology (CH) domain-containing protein n=1 Tax=Angiostrongylus costaricensis TaxID=334426 RepID=A0A0R3PH92_ANGCS|nr:unnamed protein product [Angiostrongylus costaricensis]
MLAGHPVNPAVGIHFLKRALFNASLAVDVGMVSYETIKEDAFEIVVVSSLLYFLFQAVQDGQKSCDTPKRQYDSGFSHTESRIFAQCSHCWQQILEMFNFS